MTINESLLFEIDTIVYVYSSTIGMVGEGAVYNFACQLTDGRYEYPMPEIVVKGAEASCEVCQQLKW